MEEEAVSRVESWNDALLSVIADYDADIYFYSAGIDDSGFGKLTQEVKQHSSRPNVLLVLVTNGGLANSAYQIARLLQNEYDNGKFILFCPSRCKSAGTLVALGANELLMDTFSELGPLDVQLVRQNEIALRKSGLLSRSAFDSLADSAFELYEGLMFGITLKSNGNVSFKLASELSATMASTMMASVYEQINPETVGSENRDLNVAFQYGCRLAKYSTNSTPFGVHRLVHDYPSHDFIIDAQEAGEIFSSVTYPSEGLYRLVTMLGNVAYDEASPGFVRALTVIEGDEDGTEDESSGGGPEPDGATSEAPVEDSGEADRARDPEQARRRGGTRTPRPPKDQPPTGLGRTRARKRVAGN